MKLIDTLTIAYVTARKDPQFWWFISSLRRQVKKMKCGKLRIIVIDFWCQPLPYHNWDWSHVTRRKHQFYSMAHDFGPLHIPPKPTVNQGPHRLTKNDYFSPSNSRNTALCKCETPWLAYVDDVSCLGPDWLTSVVEAIQGNYVACGAFRKVKNLVVDGGKVIHFDPHWDAEKKNDLGLDSRSIQRPGNEVKDCPYSWLFGCSVVMPVSALEQINGWPETICDSTGVGAEDGFLGCALVNNGSVLKYDKRMFTYESEEYHHQDPKMTRIDKGKIGTPDSKSWAAVRMLVGAKRFDNDFAPFADIASLRQNILKGGQFPIPTGPTRDWYDSEPLSNL